MITAIQPNFQAKNIHFSARGKICNILKCKADCCKNAPIPLDTLEIHKQKIVNPVKSISPIGKIRGQNFGIPITNEINLLENKCPFLTLTNRCNIYESRPLLCREYGTLDVPSCLCDLQE